MSTMHKPAAAWSRDALSAWQTVADDYIPELKGDKRLIAVYFLRRWAVKTINLVADEMPWSDWYWFLVGHFKRELERLEPGFTKQFPLNEFDPRETDPPVVKEAHA